MIIVFHQPHLTERGSSVAMLDYAVYNESLLGNTSYVMYQRNHPVTNSDLEKIVNKNFKCLIYNREEEINSLLESVKADYFYNICYGFGQYCPKIKNLIHAVFDVSRPHGHRFAAISDSLSGGKVPVVPHMINLKKGKLEDGQKFRKFFNIPESATLIGRHGGVETFDIQIAKDAVKICADYGVYFVFLNTEKFINHERVIFLKPIVDIQMKTEFIMACDAMLHARRLGETFGLCVGEFSVCEKPVICYKHAKEGEDHHLRTLGENGYYYETVKDLINIILKIKGVPGKNCYEKYSPEKVMEQFKKVFLD